MWDTVGDGWILDVCERVWEGVRVTGSVGLALDVCEPVCEAVLETVSA